MNWKNLKTRSKLRLGFGTIVTLTLVVALIAVKNNADNLSKTLTVSILQDLEQQYLIGRLNTRAYIDLKDTAYYNKAQSAFSDVSKQWDNLKLQLKLDDGSDDVLKFEVTLKAYFDNLQKVHDVINKQAVVAQQRKDTRNTFIKDFEKTKLARDNEINFSFNEGRLQAVYLLSSIKEEYYKKAETNLNKAIDEAIKGKHLDLKTDLENYKKTIDDYYQLGITLKELETDMKAQGAILTLAFDKISDKIDQNVRHSNTLASVSVVVITLIVLIISLLVTTMITRYFVKMLNNGVKLAETFASGNLTVQITEEDKARKDEFGDLTRALVTMGQKLNEVVTDIYNGAKSVAIASEQINGTTQQISQGANEQASSVEEVSSSMEQMVSNIQMNADNAGQTEKITQLTAHNVKQLAEGAEKSLESVRQISGKISIINDIAFQTNILALNAAVEAARAGEHGKGFAVVAAEVRKLAERSKDAANEIVELANSSLRNTEESVSQMIAMTPDIERTARLVQEISVSSKEQSNGSDQINSAIQQLNTVTQQNAAASEELATSAEELAGQAEQLRQTVAYFKVAEVKYSEQSFRNPTPARRVQPTKAAPLKPTIPKAPVERKSTPIKTDSYKPSKGINIKLDDSRQGDADFERF